MYLSSILGIVLERLPFPTPDIPHFLPGVVGKTELESAAESLPRYLFHPTVLLTFLQGPLQQVNCRVGEKVVSEGTPFGGSTRASCSGKMSFPTEKISCNLIGKASAAKRGRNFKNYLGKCMQPQSQEAYLTIALSFATEEKGFPTSNLILWLLLWVLVSLPSLRLISDVFLPPFKFASNASPSALGREGH